MDSILWQISAVRRNSRVNPKQKAPAVAGRGFMWRKRVLGGLRAPAPAGSFKSDQKRTPMVTFHVRGSP